jgi:hypothetical protein
MMNRKWVLFVPLVIAAIDAAKLLAGGSFTVSGYGNILISSLPEMVILPLVFWLISPHSSHRPDAAERQKLSQSTQPPRTTGG